jgi:hypothetical protein
LHPFSTEDASTAPTIKDNRHTAKEKVDPPSHLTDPLLILTEVAASPLSNLTNYINPNDQTGTTIHTNRINKNNNNNSNATPICNSPPYHPTQHPTTLADFLLFSKILDIGSNPQICLVTSNPITVPEHPTITARSETKWSILATLLEFGYKDMSTSKQKKCKRCCDLLFILWFYSHVICTYSNFCKWYQSYQQGKRDGNLEHMFTPKTYQKSPYTIDMIECKFPGFLHECYYYAASIKGTDAQLETILTFMYEYARIHFPSCPIHSTLTMTRHHFYKFFGTFNGKYHAPTTKPWLTDEKKKKG